jgi:hypothetical protein
MVGVVEAAEFGPAPRALTSRERAPEQSQRALPKVWKEPALPHVFCCNRIRMRPTEPRAMKRAENEACGARAEGLNQEVPVAEVDASPW